MRLLRSRLWRCGLAVVLVACAAAGVPEVRAETVPEGPPATPKAVCGPGSRPESGRQGRVTAADVKKGVTAKGLTCNAQILSQYGSSGGYKVHRFVDASGHECAFYDTTLLWPGAVADQMQSGDGPGVFVLDMADPAKPVRTATLSTAAMQSPHESVVLNEARGLLIAVAGNPLTAPGVIDIYDIATDCRRPALLSSTPIGIIGHESAFAPDGMTFYATSFGTVTAIDVLDPTRPSVLWVGRVPAHGMSISDDGTRAYVAALSGVGPEDDPGLIILDVSQIQFREPVPIVTVVSETTWDNVSIPQNTVPITIDDHPFLLEFDEFAGQGADALGDYDPAFEVGAARIIDIADERRPKVVSNIRLEVNQLESRKSDQASDPGADSGLQGYSAHYCNVPSRVDPGLLACSFILSGLRMFDITDPARPREVAYANVPLGVDADGEAEDAYAMSAPAFAPERREVWYSDGNHGFAAIRLTNGAWTGPSKSTAPPAPKTAAAAPTTFASGREIPPLRPATGPLADRAREALALSGGQSTAYICLL